MRQAYLEDIAHKRENHKADLWTFAAPPQYTMVRVLSIDAWRDGGGWTWNNWYKIGEAPVTLCDGDARTVLQWMREAGFMSQFSRGRCEIEDDGYNVVILARGTREPLFALEYGALES